MRIIGANIECAGIAVIAIRKLCTLPIDAADRIADRRRRIVRLTLYRVDAVGTAFRNLIIGAATLVRLTNVQRTIISVLAIGEDLNADT